ncbi:60S ribosomal protein L19 [Aspergillus luchuensis]|uniref:60S ribosomal protein L19 n=1 Tax=Aspergillus kawachii TaxID=1069201 RepID=A0A146FD87_ASPKA|nr:60S ribosomal protein L19 [Aspergillus luchuensis]
MTRACTNGWFFIEGDGNKRRTLREELKAKRNEFGGSGERGGEREEGKTRRESRRV